MKHFHRSSKCISVDLDYGSLSLGAKTRQNLTVWVVWSHCSGSPQLFTWNKNLDQSLRANVSHLAARLHNNYLEIIPLTWSIETLRTNNSGSKVALFKEYLLDFELKVPLLFMNGNNVSSLLVGGGNLPYLY